MTEASYSLVKDRATVCDLQQSSSAAAAVVLVS